MILPNSPVKRIHECTKCGMITVKFWNPHYDSTYTRGEWNTVRGQGFEALRKILAPVTEDPKFFLD